MCPCGCSKTLSCHYSEKFCVLHVVNGNQNFYYKKHVTLIYAWVKAWMAITTNEKFHILLTILNLLALSCWPVAMACL